MKRSLLLIFSFIFSLAVSAQTTINGALQNSDPTFTRPNEGTPPTSFSAFSNVRYDVYPVTITTAGLITVSLTSSFDNFVILYDPNGFFPAIPLSNALIANDDLNGQNAGFTYNITTPGTYYFVVCSFKNSTFGAYTLTVTEASVLPLKLVSFSAGKTSANSNLIKWSTAEESNLTGFNVQRSSNNVVFEDLANGVFAATNSQVGASYQFTDDNPGVGNQFYRLKIIEKTGEVSYSQIAVVKGSSAKIVLSAFPNPTADILQLEMKNMNGKQVSIVIVNNTGTVLMQGQYRFNNMSSTKLNVAQLQAGNYYLKISTSDDSAVVSFVKQ